MADGIGLFLPAEATYTRPGTYGDALRAEAQQRAAYLSSMDQFYAELEEAQRQFGATLAFKETQWEQEYGLRERQLELEEETQRETIKLGREQFEWQKEQAPLERASQEKIARMGRTGGAGSTPYGTTYYLGRGTEPKKAEFGETRTLQDIWGTKEGVRTLQEIWGAVS